MKVDYKPLPLSKVRSVVGQRRIKYRKIVWHTAEMYVKTFLPLDEYKNLIDSIIQACTAENGECIYELVDFATKVNIIAAYALIELPEDIDELYYIVYETDLYDTVCKNANKDQVASVLTFVSDFVKFCVG
jgi:hypothetical protein